MPLIELDDVGHRYGDHVVLRELSLRLTEHRVGVVGGNGSGKSTFARLLNGLVRPTSGHVRVDGLDTVRDGRDVRRRVGFVFTDPDAQIVMPTVAEDVAFGLRRAPRAEAARRTDAWLDRLGLADLRDHPAHLLSGGQKQLLALASILVTEPDLLVMDEPTTLLDLANARHVAQVVAGLPQQVVMVTHQLHLLDDFDRVLVFADAGIAFDGPPADALAHYEDLVT